LIKDLAVCSPEIYHGLQMKSYISESNKEQTWIHKLIHNTHDEPILINQKEWLMCKNISPVYERLKYPSDMRYLIIFKDINLKTVRDLRSNHVTLLHEIEVSVRKYLQQHHHQEAKKYELFFHYLPSVYQLHAHASKRKICIDTSRRQHFHNVASNLTNDTLYYNKCLFLTSICRNLKKNNIYNLLEEIK